MDTGSNPITVRNKSSEIAVTFIGSRLGECLVNGDLMSASTDKRLRAVEHCSQKRVERGLFEERFFGDEFRSAFSGEARRGAGGLRIGSSFFGYFL